MDNNYNSRTVLAADAHLKWKRALVADLHNMVVNKFRLTTAASASWFRCVNFRSDLCQTICVTADRTRVHSVYCQLAVS